MKRFLTILALTVCLSASAWSSTDPFSSYANIQAPVESFRMTQFGNVSPSLYTGAMTFSVPIFSYSDPDFNIPLNLDYAFDGYRPAQYSGAVGYGWTLNCGGAITREIRGAPDEASNGFWQGAARRLYTRFSQDYFLGSSIIGMPYLNDSLTVNYPSDSQFLDLNIFDDTPAWDNYEGLQDGNYDHLDSAADIFHFSAPGLNGDFVMLSDGTVKVFNSSCPEGELIVEISNPYPAAIIPTPSITISDGHGTRYIFGGDENCMEYAFLTKDNSTKCTVASWRLKKIVSANNRETLFFYTACPDRTVSYPHDFKPMLSLTGLNFYLYQTFDSSHYSVLEHSVSLLSEVRVDDIPVYYFYYSPRGSAFDETAPSCFMCPIAGVSDGTNYPSPFITSSSPRRLSSITVRGRDSQLLRSVSLTQSHEGSAHKMYLNSVDMGELGCFSFSYDFSGGYGPDNDTYQTDHWGYWNSAERKIDYYEDALNGSLTYPGLYSQLTDSIKRPDPVRTKHGALSVIHYPTGGDTYVEYEQNSVRSVFDRGQSYAPNYHSPGSGFVPGGCRVSQLRHVSNDVCDTVSFTYKNLPSAESSGTLYFMPRYFLGVHAMYYTQSHAGQFPIFYQTSTFLPYGGSIYSVESFTFSFETDFNMPRGPIVGYSAIQETHSGAWSIRYTYSSQSDYQDTYYPSLADCGYQTTFWYKFQFSPVDCFGPVSTPGYTEQDYACLLMPPLEDYSALRGRLLSKAEYDSLGTLVCADTYEYAAREAFRDTIATNIIVAYAKHTHSRYDLRLTKKTEYRHGVTTQTAYTYYGDGRLMRSTTTYGDGAIDLTHIWYHSYPNGSNNSLRGAPSYVAHVCKPSGSSNYYLLNATTYTYSSETQNPNPISITVSRNARPVQVTSAPLSFSPLPSGYTSRTAEFLYDSSTFRLTRAQLPGQFYIWYTWDTGGTHMLTKAVGNSANKWSYTWRDQCGPTSITEPSGVITNYSYDSCGRLSGSYDSDSNPTVEYSFGMATESSPPISGEALSRIGTTTFTSEAGENSIKETHWYGGLGYLVQQIASPEVGSGLNSLVTPVVYDHYRRQDSTVYLPFAMNQGTGSFISNAISAQTAYYNNIDSRPWSSKEYEPCPSGRPLSVQREGEAHYSAGKRVIYDYGFNEAADSVLNLSFSRSSSTASSCSVNVSGLRAPGSLIRIRTINEDGDTSFVFSDQRGHEILSRQLCEGVRLDTYSVLDLRDSITCIVQPEGSARLAAGSVTSFTFDDTFAGDWCFTRIYNSWGDLILERTPGGGFIERTFDTQGLILTEKDRSLVAVSGMRQYVHDTWGRLTDLYYSRSAGAAVPYTAVSNSYWTTSTDASGFTPVQGVVSASDLCTTQCKGLLFKEIVKESPIKTGNVHIAPPNGVSVTRYHYYGKKARLIQTKEVWSDGWTSLYSYKYDFLGRVKVADERHTPPSGTTHYKRVENSYDGWGRLFSCATTADNVTVTTFYAYDDLGRVTSSSTNGTAVTEVYTYDIHGWETSHRAAVPNGSPITPMDVFRQEYTYTGSINPRYGGDVSSMRTFLHGTDSLSMECAYDHAGRLISASSSAVPSGSPVAAEALSYDRNGGIITLSRSSNGVTTAALTLTHSGNRLAGAYESIANASYTYTFDNDGRLTYDSRAGMRLSYHNGNGTPFVISNASNTELARFHYLEDGTKVSVIKSNNTGVIYRGSFTYKKIASGAEVLESIAYDGGRFLYTGGTLKPLRYITDRIGSVALLIDLDTAPSQGAASILERNYYLPYGTHLTATGFAGEASSRWRFAGKEEQATVSTLPYLDFGARLYDPFIGSWTSTDPMAGGSPFLSPYAYCNSNPINMVDPDGREAGDIETALFIIKHPIIATKIGIVKRGLNNISTIAVRFATRGEVLYGSIPRHQREPGSEAGAMRHVLWQAVITAQFGSSIAKEIGDAHEIIPKLFDPSITNYNSLLDADTAVDLKNNAIGRIIGEKMKDKGFKAIAIEVLEVFRNEGFYVVYENNQSFTIERQQLEQSKYAELKTIYTYLNNSGLYSDDNSKH